MKIYKAIGLAICLAGSLSGRASIIGPSVIERDQLDWASQLTCITANSVSPIFGEVSTWYLFADTTGEIKLQVFRPVTGGYKLIGENPLNIGILGVNTINVAPSDRIQVQPGDVLGFRYNRTTQDSKIIPDSGVGLSYHTWPSPDVSIGTVIPIGNLNPLTRTYSLAADITAVPEPSTYIAGLSALGMLGLFGWRNRK